MSLNQSFKLMTNNTFHRNYLLAKYPYSYPENRANIEPYYFQSKLLIRKTMEDKKPKIHELFYNAQYHKRFSVAFAIAFGKSQEEFLHNFEREINNHFKMNIYAAFMLLSWSLFPIFLIIAKIKQNRKTRQQVDEWDDEEFTEQINNIEGDFNEENENR